MEIFDYIKTNQYIGKEARIEHKQNVIAYKESLEEMKNQRYGLEDLLSQLRQKDIRSIEEVEYAILETSGRLSVFKYSETNFFPLPIIVSGEVEKNNLNTLLDWFINMIGFVIALKSESKYFLEKVLQICNNSIIIKV